jgi:hypothetical protein
LEPNQSRSEYDVDRSNAGRRFEVPVPHGSHSDETLIGNVVIGKTIR